MVESRSRKKQSRSKGLVTNQELSIRLKLFERTFVIRPPKLKRLGLTLLKSVPAILGLVLAIGSIVGLFVESKAATMTRYREKVVNEGTTKPSPEFVYKRLINYYGNDVDIWEGYLGALDKLGQSDKAFALLNNLASEDGRGDPRFHMQLARRLQTRPAKSAKISLLIEKHLRFVIDNGTGDLAIQARRMLAMKLLLSGFRENAYNLLAPVMLENPIAGSEALWLAWTCSMEMDASSPQKVMTRLERDLRGAVTPDKDQIIAKIRLLTIMNQESLGKDWLNLQKNIQPEVRKAIDFDLSEMSLIASIIRSGPSKTPDWSKLEPLLIENRDHPMWTRLVVTLWASPPTPENQSARDWVEKQLSQKECSELLLRYTILASASKYIAYGTTANDSKVLRSLYRKLILKQPDDVIALNNLSMLIYKYEPENLDEALKYARHAEKLQPNAIAIRDTVGEILARQGRWDEALPILESCISVLKEEWNLHNTLAQIYEQKGQTDRAAAHRSALIRIKKPLDAANYEKLPPPKSMGTLTKKPLGT